MAKKISDFIIPFTTEGYTGGYETLNDVKVFVADGLVTDTIASPPKKLLHTIDNPNPFGDSMGDQFGEKMASCESYSIFGATQEGPNYDGKAYIYDNATGNLLYTLAIVGSGTFGGAVGICESYSIVGASTSESGGVDSAGQAHIYDNATGNLIYTLDNPVPNLEDYFGNAVAICESYAIVGNAWNNAADSGSVFIYDTSTGNLIHSMHNPNPDGESTSDRFGLSVAICESYSIVGSQEGVDEHDDEGKVYILDNVTGALVHTLINPNAYGDPKYERFGNSVAINETYMLIGAYKETDANEVDDSGVAYIFDTVTKNLLHTLDNPNAYGTTEDDEFGYSVALSESYSIIGVPDEDYEGGFVTGKAYIFDNATGNLLQTLNNPNAYGTEQADMFGEGVGITESFAIVSAYGEDDAGGTTSGKAYIFDNAISQSLNTNDSVEFVSVTAGTIIGREPWNIHTTTTANEDINAVVNNKYIVDTTLSTSNIVMLMPNAELGDTITVSDMKNNFAPAGSKNVVTNTIMFEGISQTFEFDVSNSTVTLMYVDSTYGWKDMD